MRNATMWIFVLAAAIFAGLLMFPLSRETSPAQVEWYDEAVSIRQEPQVSLLQRGTLYGQTAIESLGGGANRTMAIMEGLGFFDDEPDDVWADRKNRYVAGKLAEQALLDPSMDAKACGKLPANERQCVLACTGGEGCIGRILFQMYYEPKFSCLFELRIGKSGDGGKWVCDPYKIREKVEGNGGEGRENASCLVYSIGSAGRFDFEKSVHDEISNACEIITVDMNTWESYGSGAPPDYVSYHVRTIGSSPGRTSIPTLVSTLGHQGRVIDILKIDCEGCELSTYEQWFTDGIFIRQILVEVHAHITKTWLKDVHGFFQFLHEFGYVIFHKEPNTYGCSGNCIEYAFIKLDPSFSKSP